MRLDCASVRRVLPNRLNVTFTPTPHSAVVGGHLSPVLPVSAGERYSWKIVVFSDEILAPCFLKLDARFAQVRAFGAARDTSSVSLTGSGAGARENRSTPVTSMECGSMRRRDAKSYV